MWPYWKKHQQKKATTMKFERVMMSPARAAQILERSEKDPTFCNRKMRDSSVENFVRIIQNGEWVLTHQAIAIDKSGVLIDGQHRLKAIALAGIAVPVILAAECDRDTYRVIDCGIKRTYYDRIHISNDTTINKRLVSIARAYAAYGKGIPGSMLSADDVETAYLSVKNGIDAVAEKFTHMLRGITRFDSGAAIATYIEHDPENGREFLDLWYSGARLQRESPILVMREGILSRRVTGGMDAYWKMIRATQAHAKGVNVARISPANEDWMGNVRGVSALRSDKKKNGKKKKDTDQ